MVKPSITKTLAQMKGIPSAQVDSSFCFRQVFIYFFHFISKEKVFFHVILFIHAFKNNNEKAHTFSEGKSVPFLQCSEFAAALLEHMCTTTSFQPRCQCAQAERGTGLTRTALSGKWMQTHLSLLYGIGLKNTIMRQRFTLFTQQELVHIVTEVITKGQNPTVCFTSQQEGSGFDS